VKPPPQYNGTDPCELAAGLRATPASGLLSGHPHPLDDELYGDWWRAERRVSAANRPGRYAVDVLRGHRPLAGHPALFEADR
jgi:hypothetical protein